MPVFARAIGAARAGDTVAAEKDVQELAELVDTLKEGKDRYWATEVEVQHLSAMAWTDYAKGYIDGALTQMRGAADLEDTSEKSAVTPGRLIPARELLSRDFYRQLVDMAGPDGMRKELGTAHAYLASD
jgi:hypothetical protein